MLADPHYRHRRTRRTNLAQLGLVEDGELPPPERLYEVVILKLGLKEE
ncbi:MAG: hypothetical protein GWN99_02595 [Gemmatimonadetes bacterium]|uniref:Uncharacterized protein n=1 Tax=Candidatus Kutchimonas denitrificans TaxID=3056748 RepID=A0AAE4Z6W8_9BACT|nr:hypothetical protein [Gemmatimonadota bacterium]NIR74844.1 hypothetical protein [Candidatus Kutchimonas denitrificans]NIR99955.1 hypothetical protein [Gemmatimonadota bacterium]NIT65539.1 hypothetical protein [Gemmatimonadota bacterium]NIU52509.1 hypothetical protein [Gemmatimonadota bacterium]